MLPIGTITFLFTDIEGSTRLLEQLKEGYAALLAEHHAILRKSIENWNGHEIDTQGDAFFVAFQRAVDALGCVIEAQQELAAHQWPEGVVVRVRMGLHTGEPIIGRTGYVGMDVHRAARIASAGYGGQVLLSQTTRDLVYQDMPRDAGIRDLGAHRLKDIRYSQPIFQLEIKGLPSDFPPLKTLATEEQPPTPGETPFKGMQFFDESDAPLFFGREQVTQRLLEGISTGRFLVVIGASGSGKSSVVRAGLIPALKKNQPGCWQIVLLTPAAHPIEALAVALTQESGSVITTTTLIDDLKQEPRALHAFARRRIPPSRAEEEHLLVVVDQFEELFTLCRDEHERRAFVNNLLTAATIPGPVHVLITLRADFYEHLSEYKQLRELVARNQEYLGAMSAEELRQAIEEPARLGGWEFSPGLVELMLHEVGAEEGSQPEPGALPLLSHALLETWKHRRGNLMNLKAYGESGGVRKAIAHTAERLYTQELSPAQQQIARSIFLRLTELGEGTQDTRRRATYQELFPLDTSGNPKDVEDVLLKLVDARLVITGAGTAEVAHEALIREWPTLREWLMQDRDGLRLQRHLAEAAQEWHFLERDPGILYRGARLAQALEWVKANPGQLNEQEQTFLDESRSLAEREEAEKEAVRQRELEASQRLAEEQSRSAKRLRKRAIYLSLALIVAVVMVGVAVLFARRSAQNATLARSRELAAEAENNLTVDPQRSLLLALEAVKTYDNSQAENALHRAVEASRLRDSVSINDQALVGVRLFPNGRQVAAISQDGNIYIWSLDPSGTRIDRTSLRTIPNPMDYEVSMFASGYTMDISPDERWLAAAAEKHSVNVWESASGKPFLTLSGHSGDVYTVSFSPDSQLLATGGADATVKIWEAATGREIHTLTSFAAPVQVIVFSKDGQHMAVGTGDGQFMGWEIQPKENGAYDFIEIFRVQTDNAQVISLEFNPTGDRLAVGACNYLMLYDIKQGSAASEPVMLLNIYAHDNCLNAIHFSSNGEQLYSGATDGLVKVWDIQAGRELFRLAGNISGVSSIAVDLADRRLFTANYGGSLNVWAIDPAGNQEWFNLDADGWALSNDGKSFLSLKKVNDTGYRIEFWSISPVGLAEAPAREAVLPVNKFIINPTLTQLVSLRYDETARVTNAEVWDLVTGQMLRSFPVFRSAQDSGTVCQPLIDCLPLGSFNPDGTQFSIYSDTGSVLIWDLETGKLVREYPGPTGYFKGLRYSQDGSLLAIFGTDDPILQVWDTASGNIVKELKGHSAGVKSAIFSPDGKRLLTGSLDRTARMWDLQTGKELFTLTMDSPINDVGYSLDGRLIATASWNDTLKVWEAASGRELLSLTGFFGKLTPDGKRLITRNYTGLFLGYYLDINDLRNTARSRLIRTWTQEECVTFLHIDTCPAAP